MAQKPEWCCVARATVNPNWLFPKAWSKTEVRVLYILIYVCRCIFPPFSVRFHEGLVPCEATVDEYCKVLFLWFCAFSCRFFSVCIIFIGLRVISCPLAQMVCQYLEALLSSLYQQQNLIIFGIYLLQICLLNCPNPVYKQNSTTEFLTYGSQV